MSRPANLEEVTPISTSSGRSTELSVRTRFLGDGDTVVMEGRYRARSHTATSKPLDAEVVHVWDLRDAKIVRFHQHVDTRQLAAVMGADD